MFIDIAVNISYFHDESDPEKQNCGQKNFNQSETKKSKNIKKRKRPTIDEMMSHCQKNQILPIFIGTDPESNRISHSLANKYETGCYLGIHPTQSTEFLQKHNKYEQIEYINHISQLFDNSPSVIAIGECGLDWARTNWSKEDQQIEVFTKFLKYTSYIKNCSYFLHCREAYEDFIEILKLYFENGTSRINQDLEMDKNTLSSKKFSSKPNEHAERNESFASGNHDTRDKHTGIHTKSTKSEQLQNNELIPSENGPRLGINQKEKQDSHQLKNYNAHSSEHGIETESNRETSLNVVDSEAKQPYSVNNTSQYKNDTNLYHLPVTFAKGKLKGVLHCFTGTIPDLKLLLETTDLFIGLTGLSLSENLEFINILPIERILIESDSPYCRIKPKNVQKILDFVKLRNKQCDEVNLETIDQQSWNKYYYTPCDIPILYNLISILYKISLTQLKNIIVENFCRCFGKKGKMLIKKYSEGE